MIESTPSGVLFLCPLTKLHTLLTSVPPMGYITSVGTEQPPTMAITDRQIIFADAVSDEGIDYGTGYYVTHEYSDGQSDFFGPFNHIEDALHINIPVI